LPCEVILPFSLPVFLLQGQVAQQMRALKNERRI